MIFLSVIPRLPAFGPHAPTRRFGVGQVGASFVDEAGHSWPMLTI